jgi:acetyl-CoA synthetase
VDTWWQTENGGIMIAFVTPTKPTYASLPLPGINPWMKRNEIEGNQVTGSLCIKFPWPGIARTIWGDHQIKTRFSTFQVNISLETALCDEVGIIELRAA